MTRTLRLLWALLILALALPAMQARACHAPDAMVTSMAMTMTGDHAAMHHEMPDKAPGHAPARAPASMAHDCMGCVAPINVHAYRPAERPRYAIERLARLGETRFAPSLNAPPEPPPPRLPA